jgi:hypothetical protein
MRGKIDDIVYPDYPLVSRWSQAEMALPRPKPFYSAVEIGVPGRVPGETLAWDAACLDIYRIQDFAANLRHDADDW